MHYAVHVIVLPVDVVLGVDIALAIDIVLVLTLNLISKTVSCIVYIGWPSDMIISK